MRSARKPGAQRAQRWLARLARIERLVVIAAFTVLVLTVFADVVSRELTGRGLYWALQTGLYANLVVVMVGLGLASQDGTHLRPRFADRWLPAAWDPVLQRAAEALTALFCAGFALVALDVVLETRSLGERSPVLGNPLWPVQAIIPLAFGIAGFRHALYAWYPELRPAPPDPATAE